ncbi:hypothetical protein ABIB40_003844 [Pedobacter sp. UYP30]|uniref:hypothetical protein n=1 Tax=Pedobacter sp. UYP30 TaxID=1756400 RepID=UPI0033981E8C
MIKTSTTKNSVNSPQNHPDVTQEVKFGVDLDAFYGHISPKLDLLKRNPSADIIQRILDYSKSK